VPATASIGIQASKMKIIKLINNKIKEVFVFIW